MWSVYRFLGIEWPWGWDGRQVLLSCNEKKRWIRWTVDFFVGIRRCFLTRLLEMSDDWIIGLRKKTTTISCQSQVSSSTSRQSNSHLGCSQSNDENEFELTRTIKLLQQRRKCEWMDDRSIRGNVCEHWTREEEKMDIDRRKEKNGCSRREKLPLCDPYRSRGSHFPLLLCLWPTSIQLLILSWPSALHTFVRCRPTRVRASTTRP